MTTIPAAPANLQPDVLLALSDERDLHDRLRLTAWRDGYRAACADLDVALLAAFGDGWDAGLRAGAERRSAA